MKNKKILLLVVVFSLYLCACNISNPIGEEYSQESYIVIENTVIDRVTSIGAIWYIDGESIGSTGTENADHTIIEDDRILFCIQKNDIPENSDLKKFAIKISVTETNGKI